MLFVHVSKETVHRRICAVKTALFFFFSPNVIVFSRLVSVQPPLVLFFSHRVLSSFDARGRKRIRSRVSLTLSLKLVLFFLHSFSLDTELFPGFLSCVRDSSSSSRSSHSVCASSHSFGFLFLPSPSALLLNLEERGSRQIYLLCRSIHIPNTRCSVLVLHFQSSLQSRHSSWKRKK